MSKEPPLKANLFLSFQTVQKIHTGMEFQIFFLFFPTKEPFQLSNTSMTVSGNTQWTPNKARIISQRTLASVQCKRMWFTFSSSQLHKKQQLGSCHPRLWSLSKVRIFPHVATFPGWCQLFKMLTISVARANFMNMIHVHHKCKTQVLSYFTL